MDVNAPNTLPKKERLHGRESISRLLANGRHGCVDGIRYLYLRCTGAEENRIMLSVPKKLFKRAVKRNLLKRRLRESWRRQKQNLHIEGGVDILFMYSTKDLMDYRTIYEVIGQIIEKINRSYQPESDSAAESENAGIQ